MIVMNRTTYLCSPPTSDDESAEDTNTDKVRPKKKSMRNKNLRNKAPNEIIGSKGNTNKELQQQTAPDKTKCNTQETHRNNVEFNTDTNFPGTLDDRVDNPNTSSEAELINPIHAKWLDDHRSRIEEFKNFQGRKGDYYSKSEEIGIFWWLIKNDKIDQVGSEGTFKQLIEDGYLTHRSWKGIYNHFRRQMLSRLPAFKLPDDVYKKLKLYVNGLQSI
ncbi:GSCOCG00006378001-RA-CDS [Cotesia congregata]|nr:GSCOCG00006378001-RA-CDS [Cotesia congregata]